MMYDKYVIWRYTEWVGIRYEGNNNYSPDWQTQKVIKYTIKILLKLSSFGSPYINPLQGKVEAVQCARRPPCFIHNTWISILYSHMPLYHQWPLAILPMTIIQGKSRAVQRAGRPTGEFQCCRKTRECRGGKNDSFYATAYLNFFYDDHYFW